MAPQLWNVISTASFALGLVGFTMHKEPTVKARIGDSSVRIAVDLNGVGRSGLQHAAGNAPLVLAFNENREHCGRTSAIDHLHIKSGAYLDMIITQKEGLGQERRLFKFSEPRMKYVSHVYRKYGRTAHIVVGLETGVRHVDGIGITRTSLLETTTNRVWHE